MSAPERAPPLLDQVGVRQLGRLAAERWTPTTSVEAAGQPRVRASPAGRRRRPRAKSALALMMVLLGMLLTAGMAYGAWIAIADEDGLTVADSARLALMALLVLAFFGQLATLSRLLPGGRWLLARLAPPEPRSAAKPPPLLDQLSAEELATLAPPALGTAWYAGLRSRVRRSVGLGTWVLIVVLVAAFLALTAGVAAGSAWSHLASGVGLDVGFVVQVLLLPFLLFGLAIVMRVGIAGARDVRLRNRRRLLRRLLRYLLRMLDGARPSPAGGGSAALPGAAALGGAGQAGRLSVASVTTAGVLVLALLPHLVVGAPGAGSDQLVDHAPPAGGSPNPSGDATGTASAPLDSPPSAGTTPPDTAPPTPIDGATAAPDDGVTPVPSPPPAPTADGTTAGTPAPGSPTPSQPASPGPTSTAMASSPAPSASSSAGPTPSAAPTAGPTPSPAPSATPTRSPSPTPTPTATPSPSPAPTRSPSPTAKPTPSPTPSPSPTRTR